MQGSAPVGRGRHASHSRRSGSGARPGFPSLGPLKHQTPSDCRLVAPDAKQLAHGYSSILVRPHREGPASQARRGLSGVRRAGKTFLCQSLDGKRVALDENHRLPDPTEMLKIAADHRIGVLLQGADRPASRRPGAPLAIECQWSAAHWEAGNLQIFRNWCADGENWLLAGDVDEPCTLRVGGLEVRVLGLPHMQAELGAGQDAETQAPTTASARRRLASSRPPPPRRSPRRRGAPRPCRDRW